MGIVGCGLMGNRRAAAIAPDRLVACTDIDEGRAGQLADEYGAKACESVEALLDHQPDAVIVAVTHDRLADIGASVLAGGAHLLVEKPAGIGTGDIDRLRAAEEESGRRVKVGFNHRFHSGTERAIELARSGRFGDIMFARGRYGHGGRIGYAQEWRMRPELSGGGELTDQGMHMLDLCHALLGPLPLASALLRTQFWETPVEDNAVVTLGDPGSRRGPWATFHVTWTEWKNLFALEIYCRTGKLRVEGLAGSYGPQRLWVYAMKPELGPPEVEEIAYPPGDPSWEAEWSHFRDAIRGDVDGPMRGDLSSARWAWEVVEEAYRRDREPKSGSDP